MFPRDTENHCFNLLIRSELKCEKWFEGQNSSGCSGSAIQIIVTVKIRKKSAFPLSSFQIKNLKNDNWSTFYFILHGKESIRGIF